MNEQQYHKEVMAELEMMEASSAENNQAAHRVSDATDCAADSALLKE